MQSTPVILGIDIGSWTFKLSAFNGQTFETLVNEANFRQTPSLVAYTQSERMVGESAMSKIKSNFANTIRAPMRLIGIENHYHLVQQELKHATVQFELNQDLFFYVNYQNQKTRVRPEQLLMALMGKIKEIVDSHGFTIFAATLAVPSFLTNYQRSIILKCAQLMKLGTYINLVEDWVALATEYSYFRVKQIKSEHESRCIAFVDLGYSKFSVFIVEFRPNGAALIDFQHLRFTGSKNMDHFLTEFYSNHFKQQTKHQTSLLSNPKSLTKLTQNIDKQRKVLSANIEHQLNIEYVLQDMDLNYNMKREQFEYIVMPVMGQIASVLQNIKQRVEHFAKIGSVELVGGATRIPFVQSIIAQNLGIQPSKTLNASEALTRGAAIYGALMNKFLPPFEYAVDDINLYNIGVAWHSTKEEDFFGQDQKKYTRCQGLFANGLRVPAENVVNLGNQGLVEVYVFYQREITASKSILYLRVNSPNRITFSISANKVITATLLKPPFVTYNSHQRSETKWAEFLKLQLEMQANDRKITQIYNKKNEFQGLIYTCRDKMEGQFNGYITFQEKTHLKEFMQNGEKWIQTQNQKKVGSDTDLNQYISRIQQLRSMMGIIQQRKRGTQSAIDKYNTVLDVILKALSTPTLSPNKRMALTNLQNMHTANFQNLKSMNWENSDKFVEASEEIKKEVVKILMERSQNVY